LHINNTANTKVRGKGGWASSPSSRFENKSYMLWFITAPKRKGLFVISQKLHVHVSMHVSKMDQ